MEALIRASFYPKLFHVALVPVVQPVPGSRVTVILIRMSVPAFCLSYPILFFLMFFCLQLIVRLHQAAKWNSISGVISSPLRAMPIPTKQPARPAVMIPRFVFQCRTNSVNIPLKTSSLWNLLAFPNYEMRRVKGVNCMSRLTVFLPKREYIQPLLHLIISLY